MSGSETPPLSGVCRHLLIVAEREDAEAVAEAAAVRFGLPSEPAVHREALAGDDDAEDAQWVVVIEGDVPAAATPEALESLAGEWDGWYETE